jgi:hypothetical protein
MNLIDDIPQVSHQKNVVLTAPYLEDEVKKAVFQMEHNKTPDSNGFLQSFSRLSKILVKNIYEVIAAIR